MELEVRCCHDFNKALENIWVTGMVLKGEVYMTKGQAGIYVDPNHHFVPTQVTEKTPTVFIGTGLSW